MFYGFFYAALPTLSGNSAAEISLADFDELAAGAMSGKRFRQLVSWDDRDSDTGVAVYREMRKFDDFLKLRIAGERQEKLGVFSELPPCDDYYSEVEFALPGAVASADPVERERIVEQIRWRKIDELEAGHELDFTALCCYRMRLASLEKYRRRAADDGNSVFERMVDRLSGAVNSI